MTDNHGENNTPNQNLTFSENLTGQVSSESHPHTEHSEPRYEQYSPKKTFDFCEKLADLADVLAIIFVVLAGISVLYNLLAGIVSTFSAFSTFSFFSYFSTGIFHAAVYIFFAFIISTVGKKSKK